MTLLNDLHWRYATKRMNKKRISDKDLKTILEVIRLAPTSMGMQAFKVFVISEKELINKIYKEAASRQLMLESCSHLLVFAAYSNLNNSIVEQYIDRIAHTREVTLDSLQNYKERLQAIAAMSAEDNFAWTARQVYIAMAYASIAAANIRVDSTPVEGFDNSEVDKILDLPSQNLKSVLLFPLGYRDENTDPLIYMKKVRKTTESLFEML